MKAIVHVTILLMMVGCASQNQPSPTQNSALNSISNSTAAKKKEGIMQRSLDEWLKNDWEKKTADFDVKKMQKNEQKTTSNKEEKGFLQYYIDKAFYYHEKSKNDSNTSHVEELKKLPVINGVR